jgi:hypothetical protein
MLDSAVELTIRRSHSVACVNNLFDPSAPVRLEPGIVKRTVWPRSRDRDVGELV